MGFNWTIDVIISQDKHVCIGFGLRPQCKNADWLLPSYIKNILIQSWSMLPSAPIRRELKVCKKLQVFIWIFHAKIACSSSFSKTQLHCPLALSRQGQVRRYEEKTTVSSTRCLEAVTNKRDWFRTTSIEQVHPSMIINKHPFYDWQTAWLVCVEAMSSLARMHPTR